MRAAGHGLHTKTGVINACFGDRCGIIEQSLLLILYMNGAHKMRERMEQA
jgi:hypothetical protein